MMEKDNNKLMHYDIYNKGCLLFGGICFVVFLWSSILMKFLIEGLEIHLPYAIITVWGAAWTILLAVALHVFAIIKSNGILRIIYLVFLWFFQSYYIGLVVWGNISKSHYVQSIYISLFSCIILFFYCIIFSPVIFAKLHIDPRSNAFFRILDDLNRNFYNTPRKEYKEVVEADDLIGAVGVSETILRPTGRGRFNGRLLHITTRGEFLSSNTRVKIVQRSGNLYIVEEE